VEKNNAFSVCVLLSYMSLPHMFFRRGAVIIVLINANTVTYEGWNFNSGNYLFTTDTK